MILGDINKAAEKLKQGEIGIIPTDTIYGIVTSAQKKASVEKIYKIRGRQKNKPMITLISDTNELKNFGINLSVNAMRTVKKFWPGPVSIVMESNDKSLKYLHRGTNSLAFRLPGDIQLIKLLKISGPLVAPSANPEGQPPAETIDQAKAYFSNKVDFYLDGGTKPNSPSTVIRLTNNKITVLREGSFKLK